MFGVEDKKKKTTRNGCSQEKVVFAVQTEVIVSPHFMFLNEFMT